MLLHLLVENFILIPHLEVNFHQGFTCITGETGAGKSILVGALSLILGERADSSVLREKDKKCVLEGSFAIEGYDLKEFFETNDLDYEAVTVFRREINSQGKSRAFINDTPVNLYVLKQIGEKLVDIHSQHQTLELNNSFFQLSIVDAYAGCSQELRTFSAQFKKYNLLQNTLDEYLAREQQSANEREYITFQLEELEKAILVEGEQEEAEEELEMLNHAEDIKLRTFAAIQTLSDTDQSMINGLNEVRSNMEQAGKYSHHLKALTKRVDSSIIELKDIVNELRAIHEQVHFDAERVDKLARRLDLIYHLENKHRVNSVENLVNIKNSFEQKLLSFASLEEKIKETRDEISSLQNELSALAAVLSAKRQQAIPEIEEAMKGILNNLGMPFARFQIRMERTLEFVYTGADKIAFLFAANKGSETREIQKVASGGELSRLMLAVKSLVIKRSLLPTVLFDEIDSGVSGEIAGKVGQILKKMSTNMQVIAITHLPQIAGKCDRHLLAYKMNDDDVSISSLRALSDEERVIEIARMLSDDIITESARNAARELIN